MLHKLQKTDFIDVLEIFLSTVSKYFSYIQVLTQAYIQLLTQRKKDVYKESS